MIKKLEYVCKEVNRHGKTCYYFRKERRGPRTRIHADFGTPEFEELYWAIRFGTAEPATRAKPRSKIRKPVNLNELTRLMRSCIGSARFRAKIKNVPFTIDVEWCLQKISEQGGRCAVSGIEFNAKSPDGLRKNPYAPSIDRITPALGYTPDNVRIVLYCVNMMMLDWGIDAIRPVVKAIGKQRPRTG